MFLAKNDNFLVSEDEVMTKIAICHTNTWSKDTSLQNKWSQLVRWGHSNDKGDMICFFIHERIKKTCKLSKKTYKYYRPP